MIVSGDHNMTEQVEQTTTDLIDGDKTRVKVSIFGLIHLLNRELKELSPFDIINIFHDGDQYCLVHYVNVETHSIKAVIAPERVEALTP